VCDMSVQRWCLIHQCLSVSVCVIYIVVLVARIVGLLVR
jgi:hypothetical protein